jgi:outer membrane protein OmpA-like peptidoglycan-associated protein/uncharacterized protein YidB (DUF937 family)
MFDALIREAASRFGLGDKAGPLVQMLLAYMTNSSTGGLTGFMDKFKGAGLGALASSWLGGGSSAQAITPSQIENVFGGAGGLLGSLTSKLGIGAPAASSALSFLLPAVIGKLTPGGSIPTSIPSDVMGFIGGAKDMLGSGAASLAGGAAATAGAAKAAGGGLMKWLPWAIAAAVAAVVLTQCMGKSSAPAPAAKAPAPAPVAATPAPAPAPAPAASPAPTAAATSAAVATAVADAIPTGAGVIAQMLNGIPSLKVYFDTGKTDLSGEFAEKSKALAAYLKANAGAKAVVSGYNDPTGNAAANAELSKNRAKAVAAGLKAAGVADDAVLLEKPADTTGTGGSNAEARRVEVNIRK